jgi:hypothetical protein
MATHGKRSSFKMDNASGTLTDLTSIGKDATFSRSTDTADASVFGTQDKEYVAGMSDATFSMKGLFTTAQDALITAAYDAQNAGTVGGSGDTLTVEYAPEGTAVGKPTYTQETIITSIEVTGSVGDLVGLSINFQRTGASTRAVIS